MRELLILPRGRKVRQGYGFDDIAIVPSRRTRDPDDIDITWTLGPYRFELPLLASAMDGVVSPSTAIEVGKLIAIRAKEVGVEMVVFDRGGYRFHGRIKALADAAREAGLHF